MASRLQQNEFHQIHGLLQHVKKALMPWQISTMHPHSLMFQDLWKKDLVPRCPDQTHWKSQGLLGSGGIRSGDLGSSSCFGRYVDCLYGVVVVCNRILWYEWSGSDVIIIKWWIMVTACCTIVEEICDQKYVSSKQWPYNFDKYFYLKVVRNWPTTSNTMAPLNFSLSTLELLHNLQQCSHKLCIHALTCSHVHKHITHLL